MVRRGISTNGHFLLRCRKICTGTGLNVTGKNLSFILPIAQIALAILVNAGTMTIDRMPPSIRHGEGADGVRSSDERVACHIGRDGVCVSLHGETAGSWLIPFADDHRSGVVRTVAATDSTETSSTFDTARRTGQSAGAAPVFRQE
jgi:hypothetical protein